MNLFKIFSCIFKNKKRDYEEIMIRNQQMYFLDKIKEYSLSSRHYNIWLHEMHLSKIKYNKTQK